MEPACSAAERAACLHFRTCLDAVVCTRRQRRRYRHISRIARRSILVAKPFLFALIARHRLVMQLKLQGNALGASLYALLLSQICNVENEGQRPRKDLLFRLKATDLVKCPRLPKQARLLALFGVVRLACCAYCFCQSCKTDTARVLCARLCQHLCPR